MRYVAVPVTVLIMICGCTLDWATRRVLDRLKCGGLTVRLRFFPGPGQIK
jgi:hypothetical protein